MREAIINRLAVIAPELPITRIANELDDVMNQGCIMGLIYIFNIPRETARIIITTDVDLRLQRLNEALDAMGAPQ